MKVLLTGAAGFIGSHLADALLDRGDTVVGIDDLSRGDASNVNADCHFHRLDVRDWDVLSKLATASGPFDVIIHQASIINAGIAAEDVEVDLSVNVHGTINMLRLMELCGAPRFVYASSVAIYGRPKRLPAREGETLPQPIASYGIAKVAAEHYVRYFCKQSSGRSFATLRYANIYGPRQGLFGEVGVVRHFVEGIVSAGEICVHGDGEQVRDYLFVSDCVDATLAALGNRADLTLNVGSGRATTVNDIVLALNQAAGTAFGIAKAPERHGEIGKFWCDINAIEDALSWRPKVDLAEGVRRTLQWAREAASTPAVRARASGG